MKNWLIQPAFRSGRRTTVNYLNTRAALSYEADDPDRDQRSHRTAVFLPQVYDLMNCRSFRKKCDQEVLRQLPAAEERELSSAWIARTHVVPMYQRILFSMVLIAAMNHVPSLTDAIRYAEMYPRSCADSELFGGRIFLRQPFLTGGDLQRRLGGNNMDTLVSKESTESSKQSIAREYEVLFSLQYIFPEEQR